MQRAKVNESCLFDAGNHLDLDVGFFACSAQKIRLVLCLAYSTRCYGPNLGTVRVGNSTHSGQASNASLNCIVIELFHFARSMPNAHGFFLAGDYLKATNDWFGNNHMETVCSDVECGNGEIVRIVCHVASLVAVFDAPSPQREVQCDGAWQCVAVRARNNRPKHHGRCVRRARIRGNR